MSATACNPVNRTRSSAGPQPTFTLWEKQTPKDHEEVENANQTINSQLHYLENILTLYWTSTLCLGYLGTTKIKWIESTWLLLSRTAKDDLFKLVRQLISIEISRLPLKWVRRGSPGEPDSECSYTFYDSEEDKLETFSPWWRRKQNAIFSKTSKCFENETLRKRVCLPRLESASTSQSKISPAVGQIIEPNRKRNFHIFF